MVKDITKTRLEKLSDPDLVEFSEEHPELKDLLAESREACKRSLSENELARVFARFDAAIEAVIEGRLPAISASPETSELLEKLKLREQHGERIETLKHFGFLDRSGKPKKGDAPHPA
ncbi:hypothetical protein HZA44_02955, partial [Candidatus Peregrinibacteria bacterium]|nr:hypothetical protein [Candidatus Peregrinibacteria bacterium]